MARPLGREVAQKLIDEIGLSLSEIAERCKTTLPTVKTWLKYSIPSFRVEELQNILHQLEEERKKELIKKSNRITLEINLDLQDPDPKIIKKLRDFLAVIEGVYSL